MICDLDLAEDVAGFPIVSWTEDRNLASPEAMTRAHVECRIMKEKNTGVLLFVARGTVRHGLFEEGKPWERLRAFSIHPAEGLYYTKEQLERRPQIASRGIGASLALSDGAQVLLAEFFDDTALHINCADAPALDVDRLHLTLTRAFLGNQLQLVGNICSVAFQWPGDDNRVLTYDPTRGDLSQELEPGILTTILDCIGALGLAGALTALVLWQLGAFPR